MASSRRRPRMAFARGGAPQHALRHMRFADLLPVPRRQGIPRFVEHSAQELNRFWIVRSTVSHEGCAPQGVAPFSPRIKHRVVLQMCDTSVHNFPSEIRRVGGDRHTMDRRLFIAEGVTLKLFQVLTHASASVSCFKEGTKGRKMHMLAHGPLEAGPASPSRRRSFHFAGPACASWPQFPSARPASAVSNFAQTADADGSTVI
jgi:hypothetical protein